MVIDLVLAGGVLLWSILGYFSGALKQIFKLIVIVAAYFIAKPVSGMFAENVESMTGLPFDISKGIALMLTWFIVALILSIISSMILRKLFDLGGSELKGIDSIGGLLLSSVKYLAVMYFLIASILSFKMFFNAKFPEFINKMEESNIVTFVENNNFLKNVETVEYPSRLSEIAVLEPVLVNIVKDCYQMAKAKVAPKFCSDLMKMGQKNKGKSVNIMDKELRSMLQDPIFKKFIMGDKVGRWIEQAKKNK